MSKPLAITELRRQSKEVSAQGYTLEYWPDGTYFVEAPSGEGTQVAEEAVAGVLAELFRKFF